MVTNESAKARFFRSCIIGDLDTIKTDLIYNVSPTIQDMYGNNALHLAAMNNHPNVLEYILKNIKTYRNDVQNKLGRTALNIAASQGAFECIDILLNNINCDINSMDKNFKNTPLHWCVISKCIKGVQQLLDYGADFTMVNKLGKTPIELAKTTNLDIFHLIDKFVKNKNQSLQPGTSTHIYNDIERKNNLIPELPSNASQFQITGESSKLKTVQQNINVDTTLEPDLTSNNSDESFFLDISKLNHSDNSVLNLLEESIEPVDDTSFVSSILNSGKVIQLTEAGILALEYTKNEINTPIPDRLVKSFFTTSQQYNENKTNLNNDAASEKVNEFDLKSLTKGLKRLKSPQSCSKKKKYTDSTTYKKSEFENLLEHLSSKYKTVPKVNNSSSYFQSSSSIDNNLIKNKEVCNKNQLVCLNPDIDVQPKWVEDLINLLQTLDN